jgi:hypothetical protein
MTDPNATTTPAPDSFGDLPMQPTGSGVADLEIAYEQMKLAEGDEEGSTGLEATAPAAAIDAADVPTEGGEDKVESAAHPS